jgi:hypothetical protein
LQRLDASTAEKLAAWKGDDLSLIGLQSLDASTKEVLTTCTCEVSLP